MKLKYFEGNGYKKLKKVAPIMDLKHWLFQQN